MHTPYRCTPHSRTPHWRQALNPHCTGRVEPPKSCQATANKATTNKQNDKSKCTANTPTNKDFEQPYLLYSNKNEFLNYNKLFLKRTIWKRPHTVPAAQTPLVLALRNKSCPLQVRWRAFPCKHWQTLSSAQQTAISDHHEKYPRNAPYSHREFESILGEVWYMPDGACKSLAPWTEHKPALDDPLWESAQSIVKR